MNRLSARFTWFGWVESSINRNFQFLESVNFNLWLNKQKKSLRFLNDNINNLLPCLVLVTISIYWVKSEHLKSLKLKWWEVFLQSCTSRPSTRSLSGNVNCRVAMSVSLALRWRILKLKVPENHQISSGSGWYENVSHYYHYLTPVVGGSGISWD